MTRKLFLLAMLTVVGFMAGHQPTEPARAADKDAKPGSYVHVVIFTLKKDAPKDEAQALIKDAHDLLEKIPTVRSLKIGPPAEKGTPKLAIKDFQVALAITVDDYDGLHKYLDHPMHVKYVEKHEKHLDKVLVYDFVDPTK
ncbi:MAG: Dabb family protein [Gemmataceae bacterium]|nr:Dabb family protein [Gemmataceae bacterium]